MALKKYTIIKGWDNLETFFNKEIKGVHAVVENFDRVFCRCGETHSSEGGISHKCPKCGNTDFIEYNGSSDYYQYPVPEKFKYIGDDSLCPLQYTINQVKLSGKSDSNRSTLEFEIETNPKVIFKEDNLEIFDCSTSRRYGYYSRNYVNEVETLIKAWPHFKDFEEILKEEKKEVTLENLKFICDRQAQFKVTLADDLYIQYPNLGKAVLEQVMNLKTTIKVNQPFSFYLKFFNIDFDLLSVYDYYERKNASSYNSIFKSNYNFGYKVAYEGLQEFKKNKCKGYQIVEKYIMNGLLDLDCAYALIIRLNDIFSTNPKFEYANYDFKYRDGYRRHGETYDFKSDFDDETLALLPVYIKENLSLVSQPQELPLNFIRDVETLRQLKIVVNEDNLKVKNMNYYLNKYRLAETYKLPEDKIECFIDWFEKNPLKAIQLVENRRKMTKKQLDLFIDEISKE